MKFKKTREASIIKKKLTGDNSNCTIEMFLNSCVQRINTPSRFSAVEEFYVCEINELLQNIVGRHNIYIYYNKLYNITKYDEPTYNELVSLINDKLNELKLLDNNFYNWFTAKLKNYSDESNLDTAYKILLYTKTFLDIIDFLD